MQFKIVRPGPGVSKLVSQLALKLALSFCVRCRSASVTATWLFIFDEEGKCRSFQKLKTAAQAAKGVCVSVPFHYLRLSSDILCACHLILV